MLRSVPNRELGETILLIYRLVTILFSGGGNAFLYETDYNGLNEILYFNRTLIQKVLVSPAIDSNRSGMCFAVKKRNTARII